MSSKQRIFNAIAKLEEMAEPATLEQQFTNTVAYRKATKGMSGKQRIAYLMAKLDG